MTIVAAIDSSESAPNIVQEANELALQFDEELHILHTMSQSEFIELETQSVSDTGQPIEMDQIREMAGSIADDAAKDAGVDSYEAVGTVGEASDEIVDYANDVNAKYIIIGGKKRSPAGKAIFGSVTQSTLLKAGRPVLVVMTS